VCDLYTLRDLTSSLRVHAQGDEGDRGRSGIMGIWGLQVWSVPGAVEVGVYVSKQL